MQLGLQGCELQVEAVNFTAQALQLCRNRQQFSMSTSELQQHVSSRLQPATGALKRATLHNIGAPAFVDTHRLWQQPPRPLRSPC